MYLIGRSKEVKLFRKIFVIITILLLMTIFRKVLVKIIIHFLK